MPTTSTSEGAAVLVQRCRRGDDAAWQGLVDRYGRLVHGIALREGLTREDAADVTQDVFLSLMEQLDDLERPDRLTGWLMTVTRRMSWRRRERARSTLPVEDDVIDLTALEAGLPDPEAPEGWLEAAWVHEAVATLGAPCRELLELLFLDPDEPSYAQVSRLMDLPIGSIGSCRARCLERLRRRLDAEGWS